MICKPFYFFAFILVVNSIHDNSVQNHMSLGSLSADWLTDASTKYYPAEITRRNYGDKRKEVRS